MTSRQRIIAALSHQVPDRTSIFEYVLQSPLAELFLGRPFADDQHYRPELVQKLGWESA